MLIWETAWYLLCQLTRIFPVPFAATENRGSVSCDLTVVMKNRPKRKKTRVLHIEGITNLLKRCFKGEIKY
jgi:hypothetical protein